MRNQKTNYIKAFTGLRGIVCLLCMSLIINKVNAKGYNQEDTVAANFKNKNLGDIFETITNSTGHKFFYEATEVDLDRKVTVSKSKLKIEELLDEIFKGTDLEYEILTNQIVVKRKGETIYSGKIPEKSVEISNFQTL